ARANLLIPNLSDMLHWRRKLSGSNPIASNGPMSITSIVDLVRELSKCQLLEAARLNVTTRELASRFTDPQALGQELVHRGWLTPFQINQILQGRGQLLMLGQFLLLERIGAGGMGEVFKARHKKMDRLVALKLLRPELVTDTESVARFYREIKVA